ncbi:cobalt-precorrin-5B (C(1))-methyltransferase CbiD [Spirulina sp. CS-785/01]|uniref:cobalt-precorrin-5B (C(1))-methyltransferase CbiD n=1 Tax=Spirulina sp. CS-785/01 TaxID=3021716 RepID=UPI00232D5573|nr:cobalt-precorrin-5B (C(1))-methyltransferase CbiD [Spirulina sp. CS-785/01]MDB9314901.1 cobalt-precorrin-5B (C(1))-methyltransferase CbiD [Spirulina sp. CS-785/01]
MSNSTSSPRSGYTLPVFACASAVAALRYLHEQKPLAMVSLNLIKPPQTVEIAVEQVAPLQENTALAITRSDPGDNLDLTHNMAVWAQVERRMTGKAEIILQGGEGIGKQEQWGGEAAIYRYAKQVMEENLRQWLHPDEQITVTIILPEGRTLAERTSNAAFGVVEGLSLLGTTGISQPLSVPEQLEEYREQLAEKAAQFDILGYCVGENGLHLAQQMGMNPEQLVKTANWLGPMLVAAAELGVKSLLLFGYHGKLVKLAGGIFHTHHHLADGRLEILTAHCVKVGVEPEMAQQVLSSPTAEAALTLLREQSPHWVKPLYTSLADTIDQRSQAYIRKHSEHGIQIGSVLFDRNRDILVKSAIGTAIFEQMC